MQWSHRSIHFSEQVPKPFSENYNFLPHRILPTSDALSKYMVQDLDYKRDVANFNATLTKVLLKRNSDMRTSITVM